jgi:hypothetical protein
MHRRPGFELRRRAQAGGGVSIAAVAEPASRAGRVCPSDYRYSPSAFDRAPEITADVLYVVGGLYGNLQALDAVERLAAAEPTRPTIVFNGDFHWFDAEPAWFAAVEARVGAYPALRGNVETEIARADSIGAGCGCAYPETVDDGVVQRSNEILADLRTTAARTPAAAKRLAALPMHLVAAVGGARVGIVHGDARALAGWSFAHEMLDDGANTAWLSEVRRLSGVDVFASTHTCLAALRSFALPDGALTVINNGAAGMPNFAGSGIGLISRIAASPSPHAPLYGTRHGGLYVDALALAYDRDAFERALLSRWPAGSPAHQSYFERITAGPAHTIAQARPRA